VVTIVTIQFCLSALACTLPNSFKQQLFQAPEESTPASRRPFRQLAITLGLIFAAFSLLTCGGTGNQPPANDLTAIQHTVFIIKENRNF
jgi:hypothetical protein